MASSKTIKKIFDDIRKEINQEGRFKTLVEALKLNEKKRVECNALTCTDPNCPHEHPWP